MAATDYQSLINYAIAGNYKYGNDVSEYQLLLLGMLRNLAATLAPNVPTDYQSLLSAANVAGWRCVSGATMADLLELSLLQIILANQSSPAGVTNGLPAAAGQVGEVITGALQSAGQIALAGITNLTSIALTPGDWEVSYCGICQPGVTTIITSLITGVHTTNSAFPLYQTNSPVLYASAGFPAGYTPGGSAITQSSDPIQINISAATTYYLNMSAAFSASTCAGYGWIQARRAR